MPNLSLLINTVRGKEGLSALVMFKLLLVSLLAVFFFVDLSSWQSIHSAELYSIRIGTLLMPFVGLFGIFMLREHVDYKKLMLLVCALDVIFLCGYALFNPMPLNVFVGLLSLNLVVSGLFLRPQETALVFSASLLVFTVFLEDRLLLNGPYTSFYFVFNSFSFAVYSISALALQKLFVGGSSALGEVSKKLLTQEELNQVVLSSIESAVLIGATGKIRPLNLRGEHFLKEAQSELNSYLVSTKEKLSGQFVFQSQIYRVDESEMPSSQYQDEKIWLVTNVTEEVRSRKELEQSRKLSAIGQLSAGLAHEIRNPLAGISGSVELIKSGGLEDEDRKKLFSTVLKEIDRLNALVTDFLGFASPDVQAVDEVQTEKFFEEMVGIIRLDPRSKGVELAADFESHSLTIDENKIKQVFINLIINALQAFSKSKNQYQGGPKVSVTGRILDSGYEIKVEDNGDGIKKENLASIFEPFHTTKDKGTGLGLALSHRILDGHGATIDVDSAIDSGTTFRVLFK